MMWSGENLDITQSFPANFCDTNDAKIGLKTFQEHTSNGESRTKYIMQNGTKRIIGADSPANSNLCNGNNINEMLNGMDEDAFMVLDIGDVVRKYNAWRQALPRVETFYAMKCNSDPIVVNLLAALGSGFDCASKVEIDTILKLGVAPSRIIYANTCKSLSYIQHAATVGVNLMTFDNQTELHKVKKISPKAKLIIRLKVDDSTSSVKLGSKFGCEMEEVPSLLEVAKDLKLNVIGVSFHVGCDARNPLVFSDAIAMSRHVFDIAEKYGYSFKILDIGGGYPGKKELSSHFEKIASVINQALDEYFPPKSGIRIIAEPGKYFVGSAFTLYANIIGRREISNNGKIRRFEYFINEGVYGVFHWAIFHNIEFTPIPVKDCSGQPLYPSVLWGPTCDSVDLITEKCMLPKLEVGDWIRFNNMGDYTISMSSTFNGFQKAVIKYSDPFKTVSDELMNDSWNKHI